MRGHLSKLVIGDNRAAEHPADANHPYGHHNDEFFIAVLEGVMIIVAALLTINEAYKDLLAPRIFVAPLQGLLMNGIASLVNGIWCWLLITQGRKHRSPLW